MEVIHSFGMWCGSALMVCSLAATAAPGDPLGSEIHIDPGNVSGIPSTAPDHAISGNASGQFVSVWRHNSGVPRGIYARVFNPDSSPRTPPLKLIESTDYGLGPQSVAMASDGSFWIAYAERNRAEIIHALRSVTIIRNLYAQRFDADGQPLTSAIRLNLAPGGGELVGFPSICSDAAGNAVATWSRRTPLDLGDPIITPAWTTTRLTVVQAQRLTAGGHLRGVNRSVTTGLFNEVDERYTDDLLPALQDPYGSGTVYGSTVGCNDDGRFVVAWTRHGYGRSGAPDVESLQARHFGADGFATGPAATLVDGNDIELRDLSVFDSGFGAVWRQGNSFVAVQQFDTNGAPQNSAATRSDTWIAAVAATASQSLWSFGVSPGLLGVQLFDATGSPTPVLAPINEADPAIESHYLPAVSTVGDDFIVAWVAHPVNPPLLPHPPSELRARRIDGF